MITHIRRGSLNSQYEEEEWLQQAKTALMHIVEPEYCFKTLKNIFWHVVMIV